jgi:heptosyltransferase-2
MKDRPKILVIRFSSMGDLVLITPLLKALREGLPGSEIHLACKESYMELFKESSNVSRLYTLGNGGASELLDLRNRLRRERYDIIIDAHNVLRSNLLFHTLQAPKKVQLRKEQLKKFFLIRYKKSLYKRSVSQSRRYMEIAERLGIDARESRTELSIPEHATCKVKEEIQRADLAGKRLVALSPGARWETKRWPKEHFEELIRELSCHGLDTVLIGGKDDRTLSMEIAETCPSQPLNLTGKLSIVESAAALKACRVLVTNDSAPLHLAEAVGTPVVAIFGPTVREFGYFPQLPDSVALETKLDCRPCSRNGARPCPIGTKECLTSITTERVMQAVQTILRGNTADMSTAGAKYRE